MDRGPRPIPSAVAKLFAGTRSRNDSGGLRNRGVRNAGASSRADLLDIEVAALHEEPSFTAPVKRIARLIFHSTREAHRDRRFHHGVYREPTTDGYGTIRRPRPSMSRSSMNCGGSHRSAACWTNIAHGRCQPCWCRVGLCTNPRLQVMSRGCDPRKHSLLTLLCPSS